MTRAYSSFLFWLGAAIIASVMMFHTNDHVRLLEQRLRTLNGQIIAEQESLHVLNAEWVYWTNPARIAVSAHQHLGMQATETKRVAAMCNIATLLPVHNGIEPVQPVETASAKPVITEIAAPHTAPTYTKQGRMVASMNSGHINDHMIMQHTPSVSTPDKIGVLMGTLGLTQ